MAANSRHRIRARNDAFRQDLEGGHVALGAGVAALPAAVIAGIVAAACAFDRFDADEDLHGEHDFGWLDVDDEHRIWKSIVSSVRCAGTHLTPAMRQ